MSKCPEIDPNAFYTLDQCAKMLMEADPSLTLVEAKREIAMAIASGELPVAGYLKPLDSKTQITPNQVN